MKRRLLTILSALSLLLCGATAILWARSQWTTDTLTFVAGGSFYYCVAAPEGISIQWLTGLPPDEMPPKAARGWRSGAPLVTWLRGVRKRSDGPFINVPDATFRPHGFGGVEVSSGSGQVLQPVWFIYRKSPLAPLCGISTGWAALLICSAMIPGMQVASRARTAWMQRKRSRKGLCATCGYDLRASQDRCPECGTPIPIGHAQEAI